MMWLIAFVNVLKSGASGVLPTVAATKVDLADTGNTKMKVWSQRSIGRAAGGIVLEVISRWAGPVLG